MSGRRFAWTLHRRLIALGVIAIVGTVAMWGVGVTSTTIREERLATDARLQATLKTLGDVRANQADAARWQSAAAWVATDPSDGAHPRQVSALLARYNAAEKATGAALAAVPTDALDANDQQDLVQLRRAWQEFSAADTRAAQLSRVGTEHEGERADAVLREQGWDALDEAATLVTRLQSSVESRLAVSSASAEHLTDVVSWVRVLIVATVLLTSLALMRGGLRQLHRGLSDLRRTLWHIAAGDFHVSPPPRSHDEFGEIAHHVSAAQARLRHLVEGVKRTTGSVTDTIHALAGEAQEIADSGTDITADARQAAVVATRVADATHATSGYVARLDTSSREIADVLATITEISEQTNLLALNASIEAVRAGTAAKGFSSVANEVKELARATVVAADEIAVRTAAIRADTEAAMVAFSELHAIVDELNESQSAIVTAVETQAANAEAISRHIREDLDEKSDDADVLSPVDLERVLSIIRARDLGGDTAVLAQLHADPYPIQVGRTTLIGEVARLRDLVSHFTMAKPTAPSKDDDTARVTTQGVPQ